MSEANGSVQDQGLGTAARPGPGAGSSGPSGSGPSGAKRLERKVAGRWVAGVCAGLADYFGVDATLIRVVFAALTFFGGFGAAAYLLAWALVPEEGEPVSIAERFVNKSS